MLTDSDSVKADLTHAASNVYEFKTEREKINLETIQIELNAIAEGQSRMSLEMDEMDRILNALG